MYLILISLIYLNVFGHPFQVFTPITFAVHQFFILPQRLQPARLTTSSSTRNSAGHWFSYLYSFFRQITARGYAARGSLR